MEAHLQGRIIVLNILFFWDYIIAFYLIQLLPNYICDYYMIWMDKARLSPFVRPRTRFQQPSLSQYAYQSHSLRQRLHGLVTKSIKLVD